MWLLADRNGWKSRWGFACAYHLRWWLSPSSSSSIKKDCQCTCGSRSKRHWVTTTTANATIRRHLGSSPANPAKDVQWRSSTALSKAIQRGTDPASQFPGLPHWPCGGGRSVREGRRCNLLRVWRKLACVPSQGPMNPHTHFPDDVRLQRRTSMNENQTPTTIKLL